MAFCLEVWGDYACFTRPEMKVERVSYDVITPSAARAIFEAIFWKPAIRWQITRIEVLAPIRWFSIRRNEVRLRGPGESATNAGKGDLALYADKVRVQRASLILRDVRYRLHAQFERLDQPVKTAGRAQSIADAEEASELLTSESDAKYAAMFERRASKGQCFTQPYFGTREFDCQFKLIAADAVKPVLDASLRGAQDLGFMLYDLDFGPAPHSDPLPMWFRAQMLDGVIDVPELRSPEVRR